jgi:hypothetical protein
MMTLGTPVFAQGLGIPDLGLLLVKLLAVVGGAAVGGISGGGLSRLFCRFVVHRQAPARMVKLVRLLGAALLGLAVWFWVFSPGGAGGLGGAGGWWPFGSRGGSSAGSGSAPTTAAEVKATARSLERVKEGPVKALTVEMLGGEQIRQQRFYVLEGEKEPRTLEALQEAILERRRHDPALKELRIILRPSSVTEDNPAVTELKNWAEARGFPVTLSLQ